MANNADGPKRPVDTNHNDLLRYASENHPLIDDKYCLLVCTLQDMIDGSVGGNSPLHKKGIITSVVGSKESILKFMVAADTTLQLTSVVGTSCGAEGVFTLERDDLPASNPDKYLAFFVVTPSNLTKQININPIEPIPEGVELEMFFQANSDNPNVTIFGEVMGNVTT